jgi:long-chain acyl-CoA synthetase
MKSLKVAIEESEPTKVAFKYFKNENLVEKRYNDFNEEIERFWNFLSINNALNKRIGIAGINSYEWILTFVSIITSGSVAVPIDVLSISNDYVDYKDGIDFLFIDDNILDDEVLNKIFPNSHFSLNCITKYIEKLERLPLLRSTIDNNSLSMILFTSGTTGKRKGVMHTNNMHIASAKAISQMANLNQGTNLYVILPLHSGYSFFTVELVLLLKGTISISRGVRFYNEDMSIFNPTLIPTVPMEFDYLLDKYKKNNSFFGKYKPMIWCGSANLPIQTVKKFQNAGIITANIFGSSEVCSITMNIFDENSQKYDSIGKLIPGMEVRFDNNEIKIKGITVCKGYINAANPFDDEGWLHLDDYGRIDDDGYIYLLGRKNNAIVFTNGVNIYPETIESKLLEGINCIDEIIVKREGHKDSLVIEIYSKIPNLTEISEKISEYNESVPVYKRINNIIYKDTPFEKNSLGKIIRN